jgi:hypothetical protein
MFRRACLVRVLCVVLLLRLSIFAQQALPPENSSTVPVRDTQAPTVRQSAMNMLEEVLAGTGALAVPQNRLAIEREAFPTIAARSQARARGLINQMVGEFSQAASQSDPSYEFRLPRLRQERNALINALAQTDAELALQFLTATLPYVQPVSPKDDGPDDHDLVLELAAQIASHDPHRAMQMAEQQLQGEDALSPSLITLLQQVERSDAKSGAQLFRDIVQRVKQADLVGDEQNVSFAASLLATQFARASEDGGASDDGLRSLAEAILTAASSPQFEQGASYALGGAWPALNQLVPARAAALRPKLAANAPAFSPEQTLWKGFNDAQASGDGDSVVRLIEQAPEDTRATMAMRAAWTFANTGDLERTRQLAANLSPWVAGNAIQQAVCRAAVIAGEHGDFAAARQLAAEITDVDNRATLLSEVALQANRIGKRRVAEVILGDATSLLLDHPASSSTFLAQLAVAQAYLHVDLAQGIALLERSASQLEQVLAAAAQLDGFLPDQRSFEGSELVLDRGFLYESLIQPYANATAELATVDLASARTLASRLPLPEARLMTEMIVARGVLEEKDPVQTSNVQVPDPRHIVWLEDVKLH